MLKYAGPEFGFSSVPHGTTVSAVGLADLICEQTGALVREWRKWRGWHAMPSSHAWIEAGHVPYLEHASVARVVAQDDDYEFDFIGQAHVRAYGANHEGWRVSDIARLSPRFGRQLKASYDLVRISGHPCAFQGAIGSEHAPFVWFETAYLPLGDGGTVHRILNAAVYQLRDDDL